MTVSVTSDEVSGVLPGVIEQRTGIDLSAMSKWLSGVQIVGGLTVVVSDSTAAKPLTVTVTITR